MLRLSYHTATSRAKASPVFAQAHDALPALGATHLGDLRALMVGLAVTGDGRDAPVDGNSRFDDRPLRIAELCDVAR